MIFFQEKNHTIERLFKLLDIVIHDKKRKKNLKIMLFKEVTTKSERQIHGKIIIVLRNRHCMI